MSRPLRTRVWFYRPTLNRGRWSPLRFGDDEYHYKTLVLGWEWTGQVVVALWEFDNADCDEFCPVNPWQQRP